MELNKIINSLHRLERAVLPVLSKCRDIKAIEQATGLKEVEFQGNNVLILFYL